MQGRAPCMRAAGRADIEDARAGTTEPAAVAGALLMALAKVLAQIMLLL